MKSRTDRTRELVERDHRHLWHPFTQMRDWMSEETTIIERGEGNELVDTDGNRYLDGVSSLWCNVHGHRKAELDQAVRDQLDRIAHSTMLGLSHPTAIELAERLVGITPEGLTRVFYSDAGATAVEIALKMAYQYRQMVGPAERVRFASLSEAYHGDTIGSVSLAYDEAFHRFYRPLLFDTLRIDPPHLFRFYDRLPEEDAVDRAVELAEKSLREHANELVALFVEPLVQGAAGMWVHPPRFLQALREITRELGILLICDEVATGFGRTGTMFACEQAAVSPDILCVAKGITGGYLPLAATLATEEIFEGFLGAYEERKAFFHGHTYTGNPLACAAALANLDVFEAEHVIERVQPRIAQLADRLDRDVAPLPHVADVRRHGLMVGIELMKDPEAREGFPPAERRGFHATMGARHRGVFLRGLADTVFLMPPLSITENEIDLLVDAACDGIVEACAR